MRGYPRWHYRHTVLSLFVLSYFGIRFIEFALSIVFPDLKDALGTSVVTIAVAVAASTITYAVVQLPSGALGDRFGERTVVLAALGLTGVASLLLSVAPSGGVVVVGMTLVGAVSGTYYSPATALLTDLFDETGRAIGIHRIGAQVVGLTAPLVGLVSLTYGWRAVPVLSALVVVPVFVGVLVFVRQRPPRSEVAIRERVHPSALADLLSRADLAFTTAVAGVAQFADTATFSFLPLILREYNGLPTELANMLFTTYFVAVMGAQPVSGWLSDRIGRVPAAAVALLVGSVGFVGLLIGESVSTVGVAVVLVGLGMGWNPPLQSRFVDLLGADERGMGFGLVRTAYICLAGFLVLGFGWVATLGGWDDALATLVLAMGLSFVAIGASALAR